MMRPNSESDIGGETDDNEIASYDQYIERLNDEEFMKQFERLLVNFCTVYFYRNIFIDNIDK